VAARAGVSFQTASKVLNGQAGVVSAATKYRILGAARDLGYVPNALARGLVHRDSATIGMLIDDLSDGVIGRFVTGAQRVLTTAGLTALMVSTPPGGDHSIAIRRLQEHRAQGILVMAPSLEGDPGLAAALPGTMPHVSLSHISGTDVPLVGSDHRKTGALAAEHLISQGHRRVATVIGGRDRQVTRSRLAGFRDTLDAGGVTLETTAIVEGSWTSGGARTAVHALLDVHPGITAIFAQTDRMAVGALSALAELGIRVPDDCSVVGCDDLDIAAFLSPPLTTVRIPFEETGALAALQLLKVTRGEEVAQRALLPVTLIERGSTAPPPLRRRSPRAPALRSLSEPQDRR
jgi:LacI family transcriptional regulator